MVDVGISGTVPAPDAAAAAKAAAAVDRANGGGDRPGGFLDALRNARGQQQDAADGNENSATSADQDTQTTPAAPTQVPKLRKPVIDLTQTRQLAEQPQAAQTETEVVTDDKAQTRALKDKLLKSQIAKKTDTAEKSETTEDEHVAKLVKVAAGEKDKVQADQSDDDDLGDVLTLLSGKNDADASSNTVQSAALPHNAVTAAVDGKAKSNTDTGKIADALRAVDATKAVSADDSSVPGIAADTDSATVFRLTRADGRGKSLDISVESKTGESSAEVHEARSEKIENVSVLESRRYIGLAQNSNSSSVVSALSGDSEWATAMQPSSALSNAASWTSTGKVVNTLKIQMHPIDLGLVTATMRLHGEELSVDLKVENGTAYRQLKEDQSKIVESLRAQGFAIDNVTVSIAAVDRSDTSGQTSNQSQSQQQAFQNQGQGDQAQTRQQSSSARQTENGRGASAAETGVGDAQTDDAGRSRPGYVYM